MALARIIAARAAKRQRRDVVHGLYLGVCEQARNPLFFTEFTVPDTLEGRFDMVALHTFLVMRRLNAAGDGGREASQELHDVLFADIDQNLRASGVGDFGIGHKINRLSKAFFGRLLAYEVALDADVDAGDEALIDALRRNIYGRGDPGPEILRRMAEYVMAQAIALTATPSSDILQGRIAFSGPDRS
jgi:cytochrome b pre-mRNA-processing protein 3